MPIFLSLTQGSFGRNNDIAIKMLLRSTNQLRLVAILGLLIQSKAQYIRRLVHATIVTIESMDFFIVHNGHIHLGVLL